MISFYIVVHFHATYMTVLKDAKLLGKFNFVTPSYPFPTKKKKYINSCNFIKRFLP